MKYSEEKTCLIIKGQSKGHTFHTKRQRTKLSELRAKVNATDFSLKDQGKNKHTS